MFNFKKILILTSILALFCGIFAFFFTNKSVFAATSSEKPMLYIFVTPMCSSCHKAMPNFHLFRKNHSEIDVNIFDANDMKNIELVKSFEVRYVPQVFLLNPKTKKATLIEPPLYYDYSNFEKSIISHLK